MASFEYIIQVDLVHIFRVSKELSHEKQYREIFRLHFLRVSVLICSLN
jgi:hypothetical protein